VVRRLGATGSEIWLTVTSNGKSVAPAALGPEALPHPVVEGEHVVAGGFEEELLLQLVISLSEAARRLGIGSNLAVSLAPRGQ
jgi:long-subunit acyl-CoA synthetase (AMP-forming)